MIGSQVFAKTLYRGVTAETSGLLGFSTAGAAIAKIINAKRHPRSEKK
jgi:hypothetical protein